jgi:sugar lactone lactonase YvrE
MGLGTGLPRGSRRLRGVGLAAAGFVLCCLLATAVGAQLSLVTSFGSAGTGNGQFQVPHGIAVDRGGNVYVADQNANRIEKFASDGTFILAFAPPRGTDGLNGPGALALDPQGNLLVTNAGNYRINKFSPTGALLTTYGKFGVFVHNPDGVVADSAGNVYGVEPNGARVLKFAPDGTFLTSFSTVVPAHTTTSSPHGIAISPRGVLYVTDSNNGKVQEFTTAGQFITEWGSAGTSPGQLSSPNPIAIDSQGNVFVGDNLGIQEFTADGAFVSSTRTTGLPAPNDRFNALGLAAGPGDQVFATDRLQSRVLRFSQAATPQPPAVAPPVAGKAVDVVALSGTVRIRLAGTNSFVDLSAARQIPTGSEIDATTGRVRMTTAAGAGTTGSADFYEGRFVVTQANAGTRLTTLKLSAPLSCARRSAGLGASPAKQRHLWGSGKGNFRTTGRFAAASVRGTIWLTTDTCTTTTVRVKQGRVAVRDAVRKRTVFVTAGKTYTARKR